MWLKIAASLALAVAVFIALKVRSFLQNVEKARQTGLPYTFSLITELEAWAYITTPLIREACRHHLMTKQQGWPKWARFMVKDWIWEDNYRAHQEFGDVFIVVSPGGMICYVADPEVAQDVCLRRRDFIKPREKMKMLEPFGPNVVSSEGDLWRFHFRITAPPFGEAANVIAWDETKRQVELMKREWEKSGVESLRKNIYSVGVNVIASAGFGRQQDWQPGQPLPAGHTLSLLETVYGMIRYLPLLFLLPRWFVRVICPPAFRAFAEFEQYMRTYIAEEKAVVRQHTKLSKDQLAGNLLTALLATNASEKAHENNSGVRVALTDDEVLGNMFMFFVAGYDTTTNSMLFASIALALFQDVQDEVIKELDEVVRLARAEGRTQLTYADDYPRLRYMLAFMCETLRVFSVVLPIGRRANGTQRFKSTEYNVDIPDGCGVIINIPGIHYNPKGWKEPRSFDPKRWLTRDPNEYVPSNPSPIDPDVRIPNHRRGTFLTFAEGPRACLGRRFAQAEFVCFFAELLMHHRLKLAPGVDREYIERLCRSTAAGVPTALAPAEDVPLVLERR